MYNYIKWAFLLLLFAGPEVLAAQNAELHRSTVYIGILDDAREEMVNWKPGVAPDRVVRPAFEWTGTAWTAVNPHLFPGQVTWTVGFHGKNLGMIESRTNTSSAHYLTFVQSIVTASTAIPAVGAPSVEYAPLGMGPTRGRRPLVLVSRPYVNDPDAWTRDARLSPAIESAVRTAFRRDFPYVARCKQEEIVQRNWSFPDSALHVLAAYGSNRGSYLVHVSLNAGDCGYVDDPNDPLSDPWYFLPANGEARRIGSFMTLLDAGDYNHEGRSELIFMVEQPEDFEGFALFDADLHRRASLMWSYH